MKTIVKTVNHTYDFVKIPLYFSFSWIDAKFIGKISRNGLPTKLSSKLIKNRSFLHFFLPKNRSQYISYSRFDALVACSYNDHTFHKGSNNLFTLELLQQKFSNSYFLLWNLLYLILSISFNSEAAHEKRTKTRCA